MKRNATKETTNLGGRKMKKMLLHKYSIFFYIQGTLFANYFDTICNYVSFLHLKVKIIEQGFGIN